MKRNLLTRMFGRLIGLFYRVSRIGEEVPERGPVIFVGNHPNGLVDPIVVGDVAGRRVLFLAKAPIFRMPVLGWLAHHGGAIPVYRKIDGADTRANENMFRAVYDALDDGEAIVLFPEGISHNEPGLQPLKTGAARMALGAEARHAYALGVKIVPVGLTYRSKTRFQSSVTIEVGRPISVAEFTAAYAKDNWAAVAALTAKIERALGALTINLEQWDDLPLLHLAEGILPDDGSHPVQRLRTFAAVGRRQEEAQPQQIALLRRRLALFRTKLDLCGLQLRHLEQEFNTLRLVGHLLRNLGAWLLGLPLMALGTLSWALPYWVIGWITRRARPDHDVVATVKLLASVVVLPLWHAGQVTVLWQAFGTWPGIGAALLLPVAGFYARHFWRRRRRGWREAQVLLALPFQGRLRQRLLDERDALASELLRLGETAQEITQE